MRLSLYALRVIDAIDRSGSVAAAQELPLRVPSASCRVRWPNAKSRLGVW